MNTKQCYSLKIDEELRDLLPPMEDEEHKRLEESIVKLGCQTPLFVWHGYIADGHNRYGICQKHKIPFDILELAIDNKSDVMLWMMDGQLGRRNLSPAQRIAVTLKYKDCYEKQAKESQGTRNDLNFAPKSAESNNDKKERNRDNETREKLSKLAGVGHDTYSKGKDILENGNEQLKQEVLSGQKKINTAYYELHPEKKKESIKKQEDDEQKAQISNNISNTKICKQCSKEKQSIDFYDGDDICKECKRKESENKFEMTNKSQGGSVFKDATTGEDISYDKESVNSESMRESLKEIKTEKYAEDCVKPDGVISWTEEVSNDYVEQLMNQYFVIQKAVNKMDKNYIDEAISILDSVISKIKGIEIKLNNKKENN